MNDIFLYGTSNDPTPGVVIGIGTRSSKRKVALTNEETLKLAYRLMSIAQGGETCGFERFKV